MTTPDSPDEAPRPARRRSLGSLAAGVAAALALLAALGTFRVPFYEVCVVETFGAADAASVYNGPASGPGRHDGLYYALLRKPAP